MKDLLSERLASPPAVVQPAQQAPASRRQLDMAALAQRIEKLNLTMEAARLRLDAQRRRLDALREGLENLGGGLSSLHNGADAVALELQPKPASVAQPPKPAALPALTNPDKTPNVQSLVRESQPSQPAAPTRRALPARPEPSKPLFALPAVEEESRLRTRPDVQFYPDSGPSLWSRPLAFAPYAAIAALGLTLSCTGPLHRLTKLPSLRLTRTPVETAAQPPRDAALETPADVQAAAGVGPAQPQIDDDPAADDEALKLVYSYKPQGARSTVREILSPEIESSAATQSAWVVEPAEPGRYLVSFRPYGDALDTAPVYEFEVDLRAKSVTASAATEAALKGGALAVN